MITEAMAAVTAVQQGLPEQGSLFSYVKAVLGSRAMIEFGALAVCGLLGMIGNYTFKWLRDDIRGSLYQYMFGNYPRRAALAISAVIVWAFTITSSNVTDNAGWSLLINLGLTTGFAFDNLLNKADKIVWTDAERAAHLNTPKG